MRRAIGVAVGLALALGGAEGAAEPTIEPAMTIRPARGFVDTPLAFDGAGGRLAYVVSDAGALAELVVVDLGSGGELSRAALPGELRTPTSLAFVGDRLLVVGRAGEASVRGGLLDGRGKVARRFGPAGSIELVRYDDRPSVALYTRTPTRRGERHTVEVIDLERGARRRRSLDADGDGRVAALDLRIERWLDGHTLAIGTVAGEYDRAEDQRAPDAEGWYDVPRGVMARRVPITDPMARLKARPVLAAHSNERVFARVSDDRRALERLADGVTSAIGLAEPFHHYDPASLAYQATSDGRLFVALTIDPVHPEAAARRRAVPAVIDLYEIAPGEARAVRRLRLPPGSGAIRWRVGGDHVAVLPRHVGFERGGPELRVYRLGAK